MVLREALSQDNHDRAFLQSAQEGNAVSTWQTLYLGPYAVFPTEAGSLPSEEGGELLGWRSFHCHLRESSARESSEDRVYYLPRGAKGEPPKPAPREMCFEGNRAWPWQPDLAVLKPKDELAWFKREYKAELAEISAALGAKPEFGWGWLSWCET